MVSQSAFARLTQLLVQVLPFTHSQVMEVLGPAQTPEGTVGQGFLLVLEVAPQVVEGGEVGVLGLEAGVLLVGLGLLVDRALPRILDRQGSDDDEHLTRAASLAGLDEHPAEARVHG